MDVNSDSSWFLKFGRNFSDQRFGCMREIHGNGVHSDVYADTTCSAIRNLVGSVVTVTFIYSIWSYVCVLGWIKLWADWLCFNWMK